MPKMRSESVPPFFSMISCEILVRERIIVISLHDYPYFCTITLFERNGSRYK